MQLRQIPPSPSSPDVETEDSSESDSELDYTDSDSSEFECSEEEFLCDIAVISAHGLLSREHKSSQTEANTSFSSATVSSVEPYSSLDNYSIFESSSSSSSSDSCPSRPLTPMPESSPPPPPMKNFNFSDLVQVSTLVSNETIETSSVERRNNVPRDRSPVALKEPES